MRQFLQNTLTLTYFMSSCVLLHAAEANVWKERKVQLALAPVSQPLLPPISSQVPPLPLNEKISSTVSQFGTIRNTTSTQDDQVQIFHIQDIHLNEEAQRNIGGLVRFLVEKENIDFIALEGAFDEIDLSPFKKFPYQNAIHSVADYMLQEGKISGPIHALLTSVPNTIPIFGIDDLSHYEGNVEAYKESSEEKSESEEQLNEYITQLQKKNENLNPSLRTFHEQVQSYQNGDLSFKDYIRLLDSSASPLLQKFITALNMEENLDFKQVERERTRLLRQMNDRLVKEELGALLKETTAFQKGQMSHAQYYSFFEKFIYRNGFSLSNAPELNRYIDYVLLSDSIQAKDFLRDAQTAEREKYKQLIHTAEEKEIVLAARQAYLASKLIDFALTSDEWKEYQSTKIAVRRTQVSELDLFSFEQFYLHATLRDEMMARHIQRYVAKEKAKKVLLVTGGFHSDGLRQHFSQYGYSTTAIVPKISKVESIDGSAYLRSFSRQKTPLEKLFEGQKLYLAHHPFSHSFQDLYRTLTLASVEAMNPTVDITPLQEKRLLELMGGEFDLYMDDVGKGFVRLTVVRQDGSQISRVVMLDSNGKIKHMKKSLLAVGSYQIAYVFILLFWAHRFWNALFRRPSLTWVPWVQTWVAPIWEFFSFKGAIQSPEEMLRYIVDQHSAPLTPERLFVQWQGLLAFRKQAQYTRSWWNNVTWHQTYNQLFPNFAFTTGEFEPFSRELGNLRVMLRNLVFMGKEKIPLPRGVQYYRYNLGDPLKLVDKKEVEVFRHPRYGNFLASPWFHFVWVDSSQSTIPLVSYGHGPCLPLEVWAVKDGRRYYGHAHIGPAVVEEFTRDILTFLIDNQYSGIHIQGYGEEDVQILDSHVPVEEVNLRQTGVLALHAPRSKVLHYANGFDDLIDARVRSFSIRSRARNSTTDSITTSQYGFWSTTDISSIRPRTHRVDVPIDENYKATWSLTRRVARWWDERFGKNRNQKEFNQFVETTFAPWLESFVTLSLGAGLFFLLSSGFNISLISSVLVSGLLANALFALLHFQREWKDVFRISGLFGVGLLFHSPFFLLLIPLFSYGVPTWALSLALFVHFVGFFSWAGQTHSLYNRAVNYLARFFYRKRSPARKAVSGMSSVEAESELQSLLTTFYDDVSEEELQQEREQVNAFANSTQYALDVIAETARQWNLDTPQGRLLIARMIRLTGPLVLYALEGLPVIHKTETDKLGELKSLRKIDLTILDFATLLRTKRINLEDPYHRTLIDEIVRHAENDLFSIFAYWEEYYEKSTLDFSQEGPDRQFLFRLIARTGEAAWDALQLYELFVNFRGDLTPGDEKDRNRYLEFAGDFKSNVHSMPWDAFDSLNNIYGSQNIPFIDEKFRQFAITLVGYTSREKNKRDLTLHHLSQMRNLPGFNLIDPVHQKFILRLARKFGHGINKLFPSLEFAAKESVFNFSSKKDQRRFIALASIAPVSEIGELYAKVLPAIDRGEKGVIDVFRYRVFWDLTKDSPITQRYSLALAVYRLSQRYEIALNSETIPTLVTDLKTIQDEQGDRVVFDEDTEVIIFLHKEFDDEQWKRVFKGHKKVKIFQGKEQLKEFRLAVQNSKGQTVVIFDGHGNYAIASSESEEPIDFDNVIILPGEDGEPDRVLGLDEAIEKANEDYTERDYHHVEFAKDLHIRLNNGQSLQNVTVIQKCCGGHAWTVHAINSARYSHTITGITASDAEEYAYGNSLATAIEYRKPRTLKEFFAIEAAPAEDDVRDEQHRLLHDMGFLIPVSRAYIRKWKELGKRFPISVLDQDHRFDLRLHPDVLAVNATWGLTYGFAKWWLGKSANEMSESEVTWYTENVFAPRFESAITLGVGSILFFLLWNLFQLNIIEVALISGLSANAMFSALHFKGEWKDIFRLSWLFVVGLLFHSPLFVSFLIFPTFVSFQLPVFYLLIWVALQLIAFFYLAESLHAGYNHIAQWSGLPTATWGLSGEVPASQLDDSAAQQEFERVVSTFPNFIHEDSMQGITDNGQPVTDFVGYTQSVISATALRWGMDTPQGRLWVARLVRAVGSHLALSLVSLRTIEQHGEGILEDDDIPLDLMVRRIERLRGELNVNINEPVTFDFIDHLARYTPRQPDPSINYGAFAMDVFFFDWRNLFENRFNIQNEVNRQFLMRFTEVAGPYSAVAIYVFNSFDHEGILEQDNEEHRNLFINFVGQMVERSPGPLSGVFNDIRPFFLSMGLDFHDPVMRSFLIDVVSHIPDRANTALRVLEEIPTQLDSLSLNNQDHRDFILEITEATGLHAPYALEVLVVLALNYGRDVGDESFQRVFREFIQRSISGDEPQVFYGALTSALRRGEGQIFEVLMQPLFWERTQDLAALQQFSAALAVYRLSQRYGIALNEETRSYFIQQAIILRRPERLKDFLAIEAPQPEEMESAGKKDDDHFRFEHDMGMIIPVDQAYIDKWKTLAQDHPLDLERIEQGRKYTLDPNVRALDATWSITEGLARWWKRNEMMRSSEFKTYLEEKFAPRFESFVTLVFGIGMIILFWSVLKIDPLMSVLYAGLVANGLFAVLHMRGERRDMVRLPWFYLIGLLFHMPFFMSLFALPTLLAPGLHIGWFAHWLILQFVGFYFLAERLHAGYNRLAPRYQLPIATWGSSRVPQASDPNVRALDATWSITERVAQWWLGIDVIFEMGEANFIKYVREKFAPRFESIVTLGFGAILILLFSSGLNMSLISSVLTAGIIANALFALLHFKGEWKDIFRIIWMFGVGLLFHSPFFLLLIPLFSVGFPIWLFSLAFVSQSIVTFLWSSYAHSLYQRFFSTSPSIKNYLSFNRMSNKKLASLLNELVDIRERPMERPPGVQYFIFDRKRGFISLTNDLVAGFFHPKYGQFLKSEWFVFTWIDATQTTMPLVSFSHVACSSFEFWAKKNGRRYYGHAHLGPSSAKQFIEAIMSYILDNGYESIEVQGLAPDEQLELQQLNDAYSTDPRVTSFKMKPKTSNDRTDSFTHLDFSFWYSVPPRGLEEYHQRNKNSVTATWSITEGLARWWKRNEMMRSSEFKTYLEEKFAPRFESFVTLVFGIGMIILFWSVLKIDPLMSVLYAGLVANGLFAVLHMRGERRDMVRLPWFYLIGLLFHMPFFMSLFALPTLLAPGLHIGFFAHWLILQFVGFYFLAERLHADYNRLAPRYQLPIATWGSSRVPQASDPIPNEEFRHRLDNEIGLVATLLLHNTPLTQTVPQNGDSFDLRSPEYFQVINLAGALLLNRRNMTLQKARRIWDRYLETGIRFHPDPGPIMRPFLEDDQRLPSINPSDRDQTLQNLFDGGEVEQVLRELIRTTESNLLKLRMDRAVHHMDLKAFKRYREQFIRLTDGEVLLATHHPLVTWGDLPIVRPREYGSEVDRILDFIPSDLPYNRQMISRALKSVFFSAGLGHRPIGVIILERGRMFDFGASFMHGQTVYRPTLLLSTIEIPWAQNPVHRLEPTGAHRSWYASTLPYGVEYGGHSQVSAYFPLEDDLLGRLPFEEGDVVEQFETLRNTHVVRKFDGEGLVIEKTSPPPDASAPLDSAALQHAQNLRNEMQLLEFSGMGPENIRVETDGDGRVIATMNDLETQGFFPLGALLFHDIFRTISAKTLFDTCLTIFHEVKDKFYGVNRVFPEADYVETELIAPVLNRLSVASADSSSMSSLLSAHRVMVHKLHEPTYLLPQFSELIPFLRVIGETGLLTPPQLSSRIRDFHPFNILINPLFFFYPGRVLLQWRLIDVRSGLGDWADDFASLVSTYAGYELARMEPRYRFNLTEEGNDNPNLFLSFYEYWDSEGGNDIARQVFREWMDNYIEWFINTNDAFGLEQGTAWKARLQIMVALRLIRSTTANIGMDQENYYTGRERDVRARSLYILGMEYLIETINHIMAGTFDGGLPEEVQPVPEEVRQRWAQYHRTLSSSPSDLNPGLPVSPEVSGFQESRVEELRGFLHLEDVDEMIGEYLSHLAYRSEWSFPHFIQILTKALTGEESHRLAEIMVNQHTQRTIRRHLRANRWLSIARRKTMPKTRRHPNKRKVATLTINPIIDFYLDSDAIESPRGGGPEVIIDAGGKGLDISRAWKRWNPGDDPLTFGFMGGETGDLTIGLLEQDGVATGLLTPIREESRYGVAVHHDHQNLSPPIKRRSPRVSAREKTKLQDAIRNNTKKGDLLFLSGSVLPGLQSIYADVIRDAKPRGVITILDSSKEELARAVVEKPDVVGVNLSEFVELRGLDRDMLKWNPNRIADETERLVEEGVRIAMVTHGPNGIILSARIGKKIRSFHAYPPWIHEQSTVGAGDTVKVAFAHTFYDKRTPWDTAHIKKFLKLAAAASAVTVGKQGTAMADLDEALERVRDVHIFELPINGHDAPVLQNATDPTLKRIFVKQWKWNPTLATAVIVGLEEVIYGFLPLAFISGLWLPLIVILGVSVLFPLIHAWGDSRYRNKKVFLSLFTLRLGLGILWWWNPLGSFVLTFVLAYSVHAIGFNLLFKNAMNKQRLISFYGKDPSRYIVEKYFEGDIHHQNDQIQRILEELEKLSQRFKKGRHNSGIRQLIDEAHSVADSIEYATDFDVQPFGKEAKGMDETDLDEIADVLSPLFARFPDFLHVVVMDQFAHVTSATAVKNLDKELQYVLSHFFKFSDKDEIELWLIQESDGQHNTRLWFMSSNNRDRAFGEPRKARLYVTPRAVNHLSNVSLDGWRRVSAQRPIENVDRKATSWILQLAFLHEILEGFFEFSHDDLEELEMSFDAVWESMVNGYFEPRRIGWMVRDVMTELWVSGRKHLVRLMKLPLGIPKPSWLIYEDNKKYGRKKLSLPLWNSIPFGQAAWFVIFLVPLLELWALPGFALIFQGLFPVLGLVVSSILGGTLFAVFHRNKILTRAVVASSISLLVLGPLGLPLIESLLLVYGLHAMWNAADEWRASKTESRSPMEDIIVRLGTTELDLDIETIAGLQRGSFTQRVNQDKDVKTTLMLLDQRMKSIFDRTMMVDVMNRAKRNEGSVYLFVENTKDEQAMREKLKDWNLDASSIVFVHEPTLFDSASIDVAVLENWLEARFRQSIHHLAPSLQIMVSDVNKLNLGGLRSNWIEETILMLVQDAASTAQMKLGDMLQASRVALQNA